MEPLIKNNDVHCYSCSKVLELEGGKRIIRSEECPYCYARLYCCKMCKFYDANSYNECRETEAERILDKEKQNYCSYFILAGGKSEEEQLDEQVNAANSLFKN